MAITENQSDHRPAFGTQNGHLQNGAVAIGGISESDPVVTGRWWRRNVVAIASSLLLANFVYTVLEASSGTSGYTRLSPWDFVIFPVEDLLFDVPVFALGAIPLLLAAWYMPRYWQSVKQRAAIAALALVVPIPHLIVAGDIHAVVTQRNLVWLAVLYVALTVSIQPWVRYESDSDDVMIDVRLRNWSSASEMEFEESGLS